RATAWAAASAGASTSTVSSRTTGRIGAAERTSAAECDEPLQLAGRLAIERGHARDAHLRLIESECGERLSDLPSDRGTVDVRVRDDAHIRAAFGLSNLVLDDPWVAAQG